MHDEGNLSAMRNGASWHTASPEASTIIQKLLDEIEGACDLSTLSEQTSLASSNINQSHEPVEVES